MKRTDPASLLALAMAVLATGFAGAGAPRAEAQAVKASVPATAATPPAGAVPAKAAALKAFPLTGAHLQAAPASTVTAVKAPDAARLPSPAVANTRPVAVSQGAMFDARDVIQERFVLVAAPIGKGERAQLNIYEQVSNRRPCFATAGAAPAQVDPLLGSFDFTGICNRYIDGNGYSLRVGGSDLGTVYRLSVVRQANDTLLMASPTKSNPGPEMVVARTGGPGSGFLQLVPEPGWKVMRRHFGSRALGHVYVYRDSWPSETLTLQSPVPPAAPTRPAS